MERRLGPQEALFAEVTRRGNGGIQLVTLAPFETPPDPNDVRRALETDPPTSSVGASPHRRPQRRLVVGL
jgi:hypothetical protein